MATSLLIKWGLIIGIPLLVLLFYRLILRVFFGLVIVPEDKIGLVTKKFVLVGQQSLPGDGDSDAHSFVMTSKNGGNAIIGHESAIYLNTGMNMKVVGGFPDCKFCYTLDHIHNQVIFGKEYECMPPYNHVLRERKFAYVGGKVKVIL